QPFAERLAAAGATNSLSQTLLKLTAPGVPDFYQGSELWDFSLVDPDNRRPVDYARRRELLDRLPDPSHGDLAAFIADLLGQPEDDRLKLFATTTMLRARRAAHDVFRCGRYESLATEGRARDHVFAFARVH